MTFHSPHSLLIFSHDIFLLKDCSNSSKVSKNLFLPKRTSSKSDKQKLKKIKEQYCTSSLLVVQHTTFRNYQSWKNKNCLKCKLKFSSLSFAWLGLFSLRPSLNPSPKEDPTRMNLSRLRMGFQELRTNTMTRLFTSKTFTIEVNNKQDLIVKILNIYTMLLCTHL